jgi:hypothetical protein
MIQDILEGNSSISLGRNRSRRSLWIRGSHGDSLRTTAPVHQSKNAPGRYTPRRHTQNPEIWEWHAQGESRQGF